MPIQLVAQLTVQLTIQLTVQLTVQLTIQLAIRVAQRAGRIQRRRIVGVHSAGRQLAAVHIGRELQWRVTFAAV